MTDSFRHKGLRKQLVEELKGKGIKNSKVLEAINTIPRHLFIDNAFVNFAYQDKAFPIGAGQTISQPYTVAFQTQLLDIKAYEKVLEVGTGSGYQAAILCLLDADVYTIERQRELFKKTKIFLPTLGHNCNFFYGDGYKGHVYALQEIDDTTLLKQVIANIVGYECFLSSYGGLAYVYNTNTVQINAKYEIYTSQSYWNAFPRSPQVLDLNFNGENYILINNHFKCCGDGILDLNDSSDEENRRLHAVTLLKEYIENNFANKKVIVLGDLNDELTDLSANNVFEDFITDNGNYLFTDLQIAQGNSANWSYPSWPSHLDHILITNELFVDFQNLNSQVTVIRVDDYMNSWNHYENNVSDHRPVGLKLASDNTTLIAEAINTNNKVIRIVDILGREVTKNTTGMIFYIFETGKVEKVYTNTQYR